MAKRRQIDIKLGKKQASLLAWAARDWSGRFVSERDTMLTRIADKLDQKVEALEATRPTRRPTRQRSPAKTAER